MRIEIQYEILNLVDTKSEVKNKSTIQGFGFQNEISTFEIQISKNLENWKSKYWEFGVQKQYRSIQNP